MNLINYFRYKEINFENLFIKSYSLICIFIFFKSCFQSFVFIDILILLSSISSIFLLLNILLKYLISLKQINYQKSFFTICFFASCLRISSLYFSRIIQSKPGLLWNVDLGFAFGHAQTISKHGSLLKSLSFKGSPDFYHAGPAFLSGLVEKYFGFGLEFVSLIIIPIISFSIYIFCFKNIFKNFLNKNYIYIFLSLLCFLPSLLMDSSLELSFIHPSNINNDFSIHLLTKLLDTLPFGIPLMQNSMFGGAIIFCILYFISFSPVSSKYYISLLLFSLLTIKPLYFISSLVIIIIYLLIDLNSKDNELNKFKKERIIDLLKPRNFFSILIFSTTLLSIYVKNITPFHSLQISLVYFKVSNIFDIQLWPLKKAILNTSLVGTFFFVLIILIKKINPFKKNKLIQSLSNLSILFFISSFFIRSIGLLFPLSFRITNNNNIYLAEYLNIYPNKFGEYIINQQQAAYPLTALSIIFGLGCFIIFLQEYSAHKGLNFLKILTTFSLILNNVFCYFLLFKPEFVKNIGGEEINETNLVAILESIPIQGSILLSNTVEEGFLGRKFRNTYLNSFTPHQHFLTNIRDYHWRSNPEAKDKFDIYKKVFPTQKNGKGILNEKSIGLMKFNKITHILIKSNYEKKKPKIIKGLEIIKSNKDWAAYKII